MILRACRIYILLGIRNANNDASTWRHATEVPLASAVPKVEVEVEEITLRGREVRDNETRIGRCAVDAAVGRCSRAIWSAKIKLLS